MDEQRSWREAHSIGIGAPSYFLLVTNYLNPYAILGKIWWDFSSSISDIYLSSDYFRSLDVRKPPLWYCSALTLVYATTSFFTWVRWVDSFVGVHDPKLKGVHYVIQKMSLIVTSQVYVTTVMVPWLHILIGSRFYLCRIYVRKWGMPYRYSHHAEVWLARRSCSWSQVQAHHHITGMLSGLIISP